MKKIVLLVFACCNVVMAAALDVKDLLSVKHEATGLWGFKYEGDDKWCILPQYDYAQSFYTGQITIVKKNNKEFAINLNEKQISPNFDELDNLGNTYWGLNDGKYMLYDPLFNLKSETQYKEIESLNNIYVLKYKLFNGDNCYGLMDINGNEILSPIYNKIKSVSYNYLSDLFGNNTLKETYFSWYYYVVVDKKNKYGLACLDKKIYIPCKYKNEYDLMRKGFKKYSETIYNSFNSGVPNTIAEEIFNSNHNVKYIKDYLAQLPSSVSPISKAEVKFTNNIFQFYINGKPQNDLKFSSVELIGNRYIVEKMGKFGLRDEYGQLIVPEKYDNLYVWSKNNGNTVFVAEENAYYWLFDSNGKSKLSKKTPYISMCTNGNGIVQIGNKYVLINESGEIVSKRQYDNISFDKTTGSILCSRKGYETKLTKTGNESPAISDRIFNEAFNSNEEDVKYRKYKEVIEIDEDNIDGNMAYAYNNLGLWYERKGELKMSLSYFELGKSYGCKDSNAGIKRVKSKIREAKTNDLVNSLNALATALGGKSSNTSSSNSYSNTSSSTSSYSTSNNTNTSTVKKTKVKVECWACKGTGKSISRTYPATYGDAVNEMKRQYCKYCDDIDRPHTHKLCSACKGTGYTKEYK